MLLSSLVLLPAFAEDWPQLQKNPGHTGFTADEPKPPYILKWMFEINEPTHTGSPPIVAAGKVYLGTNWGNLVAVDLESGKKAWSYKARAAVFGTPAFENGVVFANSMDHRCHAVRATDGSRLWTFETGEGILAGPIVADGKVFIAGRDGFVYALEAASSELVWKSPIGGPVMATPAYDNGVLYVGGGDNHVYAFDGKTGSQIWRSAKLPGMAIRDYWLVASGDTVIVSSQQVTSPHSSHRNLEQALMAPFREKNDGKMLVQDELLEQVRQWYVDHPHQKTFLVLNAKDGSEKFVAPIIHVQGGGCAGPLPAIGPDGQAYVVYSLVRVLASGWAFVGRLDLRTGNLDPLVKDRYWIDKNEWEWQAKPGTRLDRHSAFAVGFCVSDQSWGLTLGGGRLFVVRDPGWASGEGAYSYIDLPTGKDAWLEGVNMRDIYRGGSYGGAFHATASPMVISGKYLIHKTVRNLLFCLEGN
jgi:outer membrane protein assembly factor BamB